MKKIFTLLFLIATCVLAMQAQKRYVVAFDCTKSMDHPSGDYSDNGKDPSILWTPAKNCIKSLWKQAAPNDEFVILLYQNKILYTIKGQKGSQLYDWNSIESKMEDAITKGGNTCIFQAWQASEQYFTDNCDFYFITDGVEDHDNNNQLNDDEQAHIDAICEKIDVFCNLGINGFYTNLKQLENDNISNQISRKIKSSCFVNLIAGNITPLSLSLNQDDLNKGKKTFNLTFKPIESQRVANVQKLDAIFVDHDEGLQNASMYFKPTISGIRNNKIELTIEQISPVPQNLLDQINSCKLYLNVLSNDKNNAIFPELITVDVRYYYEKIAFLPSIELEGTSKYHPAFFISSLADLFPSCDFIAEHKPDTISFDIKKMLNGKTLFNNEAIKQNSSYKLQLIPIRKKDKDAKFTLLKNGRISDDNTIEVTSSDDNIVISIIFNDNSADGTFKFNLVPIEPNQLDKINQCTNIEEASIPITIEFDKDCNPLELLLLILIVIFVVLSIIVIFYNNVFKKKIPSDIYYKRNGDNQLNLLISTSNCVKGTISNSSKKQNIFSRLYFGRYAYSVPLQGLTTEIALYCSQNGNIIIKRNKDIIVNGTPCLYDAEISSTPQGHCLVDVNSNNTYILIF